MDRQDTFLDFSGKFFPDLSAIPRGIKMVALARATRWFGWGFGEMLLPIFIVSFSASFTEAGLVSAAYDVVFLLSLPLVALFADAVSSKVLLMVGLLIYPFIGASYYLAGATGLVLFVILGRGLNGISYCLDTVGVDTYIRRVAPRGAVASAFGYMGSFANLGWLLAGVLGAWLVQFVPIHWLLFLITPFSLIALLPLLRAKRDLPPPAAQLNLRTLLTPVASFLKEVAVMRRGLKSVVALMFVLDVASVGATFFIPIAAYHNGASLSATALLVIISALPALSEFWLAKFIDGSAEKRHWSLFGSLASLPFLFAAAAVVSGFVAQVVIALGIEIAAILGSLALQSYATVLSRRDRYGEISSMLEGASTVGDLLGPVAIGLFADALGFGSSFALLALLLLGVAIYFLRHPIDR